jgi:hypothetical protein
MPIFGGKMLRHSRANTYWMNRKYKERDKDIRVPGCFRCDKADKAEFKTSRKNRFNLIDYFKSWGLIY